VTLAIVASSSPRMYHSTQPNGAEGATINPATINPAALNSGKLRLDFWLSTCGFFLFLFSSSCPSPFWYPSSSASSSRPWPFLRPFDRVIFRGSQWDPQPHAMRRAAHTAVTCRDTVAMMTVGVIIKSSTCRDKDKHRPQQQQHVPQLSSLHLPFHLSS
jgi:hypothetical protein